MRDARNRVALLLAAAMTPGAGFAQEGPAAPGGRAPALAPLGVGPLRVASSADLDVEKIEVNVTLGAVVASYSLKNKGSAPLDLAASFAIAGLAGLRRRRRAMESSGGHAGKSDGLSVAAEGAPIATRVDVKAYALGVDRRAEITAARLPLLPFGAATAQALASVAPQTLAALSSAGIVSPRDPEHPEHPTVADWTLVVVHSWRQPLPAGKTTTLTVRYSPLRAEARFGHADALDLEDLKDEACLTPAQLAAAQDELKGPDSASRLPRSRSSTSRPCAGSTARPPAYR